MMCRADVPLDNFTLPILLKAASQRFDIILSELLHGFSVKYGLEDDVYCESGLISSYCKAGKIENARKVFDNNTERKLGSWNAFIGGLSQVGQAKEALDIFMLMMRQGITPDDVTMAKRLEKSDLLMMNSLVDMYGKCGRIDMAYKVFNKMKVKNVSSWTSLIVGYAAQGCVIEAINSFHHMIQSGITPNAISFVGVLTACVHGGLVEEGKRYFDMMKNKCGIKPTLPHYGCMVDLLGRAGLLSEAKAMVEGMPFKGNVVIWGCLMGACEKFGNVKIGEWVGKELMELEPKNDGVYVALSNIYATHGMWDEVERLRSIMRDLTFTRLPAYSLPQQISPYKSVP